MCKMRTFALIVILALHAAKSNNDVCQNSPAGYSRCNELGSLQGMLIFMQSVTYSLSDLIQSARYKADIAEGSLCSNRSQNVTDAPNELCVKAEPDCQALYSIGLRKSGVYRIWPKFLNHSINVYCDMETDNGGWTLIQKRGDYGDPPRNFFETWENYKKGFGNIEQDFWLGNDYIFALTNQAHMTLRIDLEDFEGEKRFAKYSHFLVRSELEKYKVTFDGYEGNAGNSLEPHNGKIFITKDNGGGCAINFKGGWWYAACHEANLNGIYYKGHHESYADGVNWYQFRGYNHSMKVAEMKIRPCNC